MSVQRQSIPPKDGDLETTAELPVLDVAAYEAAVADERSGSTDTWHLPAINAQAAAAATTSGTQALAAAESRSLRLETDLRALSENLRDVEERLTRKGERLLELERELANARAERTAAEERATKLEAAADERAAAAAAALRTAQSELANEQSRIAGLTAALDERAAAVRTLESSELQLKARLATRDSDLIVARSDFQALETRVSGYLETLQTLEGRRNIFDGQLLALADDLQARDTQITQLQQELSAANARAKELSHDLASRVQRIESLEREVHALSGSFATAAANQAQAFAERGMQIESITQERDVLASRVAGMEGSLGRVRAELATREAAAAEESKLRAQLEKQVAASQAHLEELERSLARVVSEGTDRAALMRRLEAERDEQINRFAAAEARAVELERRIEDGAEVIRQLQEELRASLMRGTELEGDLHAAEDAINRLEVDLRTKSTKLDELSKTHDEWRTTVESARHSLSERDSLIHRLEEEAANSALLLGNIQQSIKRLDPSPSGNHEIAPEGAVRLLIRVDGDSEVVHVLGRKTTVGRTPDNDLQIDAKFISRNHAVILAGPNHTIIEDLNSTNGVAVNGKRITRHTLRDGDNVAIGKTTFRFAVRPMQERRA